MREAKEETTALSPESNTSRKSLEEIIGLGRYALLAFCSMMLVILSTVSVIVYMVYAGASANVVGCGDINFPADQKEACRMLAELRASNVSCTPRVQSQFQSVNIEFGYFCTDALTVKSSTTCQMLAILFGAFVFGQVSDFYGRKRTMLIALWGIAVSSYFVARSTSFLEFFLYRLVVGFFAGGTSGVHAVYIVEHCQRDHRMIISNVVTWSPNFALAPVIAYFAKDWRTLSYYSTYINVAAICALFFCCESPRFLIQKGRFEEARRVLLRICRINGSGSEDSKEDVEKMLMAEEKKMADNKTKKKQYHYLDLFKNAELRKYTLIIGFGLSITSLQSYGLMFNQESLSGSIFVNGVFFGVFRWAINIIVGVLDVKCSGCTRKRVAAVMKTTNFICLTVIASIFALGLDQQYATVIRIASIVVLVGVGPVFCTKFLTASELYPTGVRNVGTSFQSMSSRLGTIFGTTVFLLNVIHMALPYTILASLLLLDIFLFQRIIPETKGVELRDHFPVKKQREQNA
ncbi:hypothetical protein PMAYCL1PPCAC_33093 [Pristionchus mayeri]|uniref:Major facilitator superfamily (MFS) profile domain-containing protein n=1 Tax=Pristionchus mayeri TaxID=1317129 RepID=A0AAN5DFY1_9BILA|nr:hypothetical protein PMAYCL1PPCAC_33093 [Pristionchus mayeri]